MTSREYNYLQHKKFKVYTMGNDTIKLNKKIVCPICGARLEVVVTGWYLDKWGWVPDNIELNCTAFEAIDIESDEWDEAFNHHYSQPYIDWLPLQTKVERSLQKKVRFVERVKAKGPTKKQLKKISPHKIPF